MSSDGQLKRFKTYILLLQAKVMSPAELEPSLAETVIGEDEETLSQHTSPVPTGQQLVSDGMTIDHVTVGQPVSRSLSDRYGYRAAMYRAQCSQFDMI